jgi:response regulator of citrate/malate metabolism
MRALTILTITNDDKFLSLVRRQFHDQVAPGSRMIVARTIEEACSLVDTFHPRLIVVHWAGHSGRYEQLDQLLWTTTVQARLIPVLVIAERYRTEQATTMYRMGVAEYISRTHHLDQLGRLCAAYLPGTPLAAQTAEPPELAGHPGKPWAVTRAGTIASHAV